MLRMLFQVKLHTSTWSPAFTAPRSFLVPRVQVIIGHELKREKERQNRQRQRHKLRGPRPARTKEKTGCTTAGHEEGNNDAGQLNVAKCRGGGEAKCGRKANDVGRQA